MFSYDGVVRDYRVWTVVSYVLFNPPSLWLLLTSYLLYAFGSEVEKHLGRNTFVNLLVWLLLSAPALLLLIGWVFGRDAALMGIYGVEFGVFLAFATLYPRAQISLIILTLEVWILAVAIVGVGLLSALASRDLPMLAQLIGSALVPYCFIRHHQGREWFPFLSKWWNKRKAPKLCVVPRNGKAARPVRDAEIVDPRAEVDRILEKIANEGISSLSEREKQILDEASRRMKGKKG